MPRHKSSDYPILKIKYKPVKYSVVMKDKRLKCSKV